MCIGSSPRAPAPPAEAPEAPVTPEPRQTSTGARDKKRRRAAAGGSGGTILTSARGVSDGAATAQKTLLGQ